MLRQIARTLPIVCCLAAAGWARAERIALVPLDDRPACTQFAQKIAGLAGIELIVPPASVLGHFTTPGQPDRILDWLDKLDYNEVSTIIASVDMIAYGGLVASRTHAVPREKAMARLERLASLKRKRPRVGLFVFGATMRIAPTAVAENRQWRDDLATLSELVGRKKHTGSKQWDQRIAQLERYVPKKARDDYWGARNRNHDVQKRAIQLASEGAFDYVIMGQDDARAHGPHVPETRNLRALTQRLGADAKVYFFEGIDQMSNVLVSRILVRREDYMPYIRVVYSDDAARTRIAPFESKAIELSLRDQVLASGARIAKEGDPYDYALYVTLPGSRPEPFKAFLKSMKEDLDAGRDVALADADLRYNGSGRMEVIEALREGNRLVRLLAYAGWNTAGNTMGTTIPTANVVLLARRQDMAPETREVARAEFLLHRYVNDFLYHNYTRRVAYAFSDFEDGQTREQVDRQGWEVIRTIVQRDLGRRLKDAYVEHLAGKRLTVGTREIEVVGLDDIHIDLPWPRAFEVLMDFRLSTRPIAEPSRIAGGGS